ncbi:hypothetical protein diail_7934, partial [Diaporthe ilicicola]
MTSYKWKPGNRYGKYCEPRYNAISYTWGRWRLDSNRAGERELQEGEPRGNVNGIDIRGVDWDVPPISPEHFTVHQFRAALSQATMRAYGMSNTKSVEFLWLDVACIDQRRNNEDGALEVGRQAAIFRGADGVFVWLNTSTYEDLSLLAVNVAEAWSGLVTPSTSDAITSPETVSVERTKLLQDLGAHLKQLFHYPWFTSLWTLQEAFLCQNALFISRDAKLVEKTPLGNLRQLVSFCDNVSRFCAGAGVPSPKDNPETPWDTALRELREIVHSRGLPALGSDNPLAAYYAAGKREATAQSDYVYGIQQVFHYRLGQSREGSDATKEFSRVQLEVEFGAKIIEDWPVLSQMHAFTVPPRLGTGWHPSLDSRIPSGPGWSRLRSSWWWKLESSCDIRAVAIEGEAVAAFRGRACRFVKLQRLWSIIAPERGADGGITTTGSQLSESDICHQISLDVRHRTVDGDMMDPTERPAYRTQGYARDILPGREQQDLALWLSEHYSDRLRILLLGRVIDDVESRNFQVETYNIGLLLTERD